MSTIKVNYDEIDDIVTVEDGERFIKAKGKMGFGFKRLVENLRTPKKIKASKNSDEITMEMDDYDEKKDPDLRILARQVKEWSNKEKPTFTNIVNDENLGELLEKTATEIRKINNMALADEEEEKNV